MDLAELLSLSGVKEECVLRSGVGFMALHGGSRDHSRTRSPAVQPSRPARPITPSSSRAGCGCI